MKKIFGALLLMLGLATVAYADLDPNEEKEAMKILEEKRKEIAKEEAAQREAAEKARKEMEEARIAQEKEMAKQQEEAMKNMEQAQAQIQEEQAQVQADMADAQKIEAMPVNTDMIAAENVAAMQKAQAKQPKRKMTEDEKLQATKVKSLEKLDFYERVVRSVAREEAELKEYNAIADGE